MKSTPYALALLLFFTLAGCQKEYTIDPVTGNTDSTSSPMLKKMSVYLAGNSVADGDDTLVSSYFYYDAQNRINKIIDSAFNKDGARFAGIVNYVYNGTSVYPVSANAQMEDDEPGVLVPQYFVMQYNAANQLIKDSSSTGETNTYTYATNLVVKKTKAPGITSIDSAFYDDKHNIVKETALAVRSGDSVYVVSTNTYTNGVNPMYAYLFPPFNALESANLLSSSTDVITDLSTGNSFTQTNNLQYSFDSKGRVIKITGSAGEAGRTTYEYYE